MTKYYAIWTDMNIPHIEIITVAEEEQTVNNITPPLQETKRLALIALAASFEGDFKKKRDTVVDFLKECQ